MDNEKKYKDSQSLEGCILYIWKINDEGKNVLLWLRYADFEDNIKKIKSQNLSSPEYTGVLLFKEDISDYNKKEQITNALNYLDWANDISIVIDEFID
jgi:hypothetical protein